MEPTILAVQEVLDDNKESLTDKAYLDLCNALMRAGLHVRKRIKDESDKARALQVELRTLRDARAGAVQRDTAARAQERQRVVVCECGAAIMSSHMNRHLAGQPHRRAMERQQPR